MKKSLHIRHFSQWFAPLLVIFGAVAFGLASGRLSPQDDLTIRADFTAKESFRPSEKITLSFSRTLQTSDGTVAIFIGETDMTSLFTRIDNKLVYSSNAPPLPEGIAAVIVYLVSPPNEWKEIARFDLNVKSQPVKEPASQSQPVAPPTAPKPAPETGGNHFGFDKFAITPSFTISLKSQSALLFFPDTNRPDRINFTDIAVQGSVRVAMKRGGFDSLSQFDLVGTRPRRTSRARTMRR